jgi:DNA-binding IclR family transcriptional regulator
LWKIGDLLNTIARTGTALGLFTPQTPEWGVTEVATILGLPKSTTYELLASLAEISLLQQKIRRLVSTRLTAAGHPPPADELHLHR